MIARMAARMAERHWQAEPAANGGYEPQNAQPPPEGPGSKRNRQNYKFAEVRLRSPLSSLIYPNGLFAASAYPASSISRIRSARASRRSVSPPSYRSSPLPNVPTSEVRTAHSGFTNQSC